MLSFDIPLGAVELFCFFNDNLQMKAGFKKPGFFLKKAQPSGFFKVLLVWGFYWVFLDKQEKIGTIIQKLSNLKR